MHESTKQQVLAQLSEWLDAWPDEEPLPAGVDPALLDEQESVVDLASMVAAVTACRRDVQIQGKSFKRLEDRLSPFIAELEAAATEPVTASCDQDELIELRDRLARCVSEVRDATANLSRLARWGGAEALLGAHASAIELVLQRVDEQLSQAGVRPFVPDGQPFDPTCMRAIDQRPAGNGDTPDSVASTVRAGYLQGESLLRSAEVRVWR